MHNPIPKSECLLTIGQMQDRYTKMLNGEPVENATPGMTPTKLRIAQDFLTSEVSLIQQMPDGDFSAMMDAVESRLQKIISY